MPRHEFLDETALAALAKKYREASGKSRTEAARELNVSRPSVAQAEDCPERSMLQLRKRIIEAYSDRIVEGPVFIVRTRKRVQS